MQGPQFVKPTCRSSTWWISGKNLLLLSTGATKQEPFWNAPGQSLFFRKAGFQEKPIKQSLIAGYYQNLIHLGEKKNPSPFLSSSFLSGRQEMLKYSPSHPLPINGGEKIHKQKQFWSAETRDIALPKTITGLWNILSPNTYYHITKSLIKEIPFNQYIMSRKNYEAFQKAKK